MKYEFHVGDYVETKDGDIGVITGVDKDGLFCWYCTNSNGLRAETHTYIIPVGTDAHMARVYNRIGQYDFTKKDEGKIEPLDYTERTLRETSSGAILRAYMKKINEIVDAVNELRMRDAKESKDD